MSNLSDVRIPELESEARRSNGDTLRGFFIQEERAKTGKDASLGRGERIQFDVLSNEVITQGEVLTIEGVDYSVQSALKTAGHKCVSLRRK